MKPTPEQLVRTEGGGHPDGCLCERGMCGLKART